MGAADALESLGSALSGCLLAYAALSLVAALTGHRWRISLDVFDGLIVAANALYASGAFMKGQWASASVSGTVALVFAWSIWRRHRRNRKRAAAMIGAKSRALIAALVRKVREAAKPRPVLRPAPGGTR